MSEYTEPIVNSEPFKTVYLSNCKRLELSLKFYFARRMLDLREWVKFPGETEFRPTRKGLMIDLSIYKDDILPAIQKLIDSKIDVAND